VLAEDLAKRFPEDTSVRFNYLPALRARLALNRGDPRKALDVLQPAVPYELGAHRSSIDALFGALYPVYERGEAYLAARQGAEAAAEFQKVIARRGVVVSDPVGVLARLQLGRALVLSGDKTRARAAYQDFLSLWKSADPDVPILRQARREFAFRPPTPAYRPACADSIAAIRSSICRVRCGVMPSIRSTTINCPR
jgi:hypothetical protein